MASDSKTRKHRQRPADTVARGLGWFSVGLGLLQLLAPRTVARGIGMGRRTGVVRAYGAREIATGVGILLSKRPAPWIIARIAGDALDMGTLAPRLTGRNRARRNSAIALGAVAGVAALDIVNAKQLCEHERSLREPRRDYSARSGFPKSPDEMRGAARGNGAQRVPRRSKTDSVQPRLSS